MGLTHPGRLVAGVGYTGAALSVLSAATYALLRGEANAARRVIGKLENPVPRASGWYGDRRPGPAVELAIFGDSLAAGYGAPRVVDTPGARLAAGLAHASDRRVHLREYCEVGAESRHLSHQLDRALGQGADVPMPDLAVIIAGGNDVTHAVRPDLAVRQLAEAVIRLRASGARVVVGTCPDLGAVQPFPTPLRQIAHHWSQRLAALQTLAVIEAGGHAVALGAALGPLFASAPMEYFGPDHFHPSVAGYQAMADLMLPALIELSGTPAGVSV